MRQTPDATRNCWSGLASAHLSALWVVQSEAQMGRTGHDDAGESQEGKGEVRIASVQQINSFTRGLQLWI